MQTRLTSDIAKHDIRADSGCSCCITDQVRRDLRVTQRAEGKGSGRDNKGCAITSLWIVLCCRQEHDVADHHDWRTHYEKDVAAVKAPGEEGEENCEECTDLGTMSVGVKAMIRKCTHNVRRHCHQLLVDNRRLGIDGLDNCRREEGETLHGDVIEQEDEGHQQSSGRKDAAQKLGLVDAIEDN